jgi:hypothetical protein
MDCLHCSIFVIIKWKKYNPFYRFSSSENSWALEYIGITVEIFINYKCWCWSKDRGSLHYNWEKRVLDSGENKRLAVYISVHVKAVNWILFIRQCIELRYACAVEELRKRLLTSSFMSVCPSVHIYYSQPPLDRFTQNIIFIEIFRGKSGLTKVGQIYRALYKETYACYESWRRHVHLENTKEKIISALLWQQFSYPFLVLARICSVKKTF